ncbi:unnamed protein product [Heterobilharzia americana]|nr:unnamed protein product [Heterobilharzia americana]
MFGILASTVSLPVIKGIEFRVLEYDPPKKNKSNRKSAGGNSPRKSTGRRSNNQLDLSNNRDELLQHIDELDDAAIESLGRDYYLFIIRQLETQVTAYENYISELYTQNEEIMAKLQLTDAECRDNFKTLNKVFQQRINEAADLIERIQGVKCVFRKNVEKWKSRENELQLLKQCTEERMTAENIALASELTSLEEFRANREALWAYYHSLESTLEELRNDHKMAMENLLERDMAYRGRLKKVTKLKINEVASEFRSVSFQRTEPTVKRMLAENVSIEGQLVKLSVAIAEMSKENVSLLTEFHNLVEEQSNLEKEQILLGTRNSAITKISHLLSIHHEKLNQMTKEANEKKEIYSSLNSKCNYLEQEKQSLVVKVEGNLMNDLDDIDKIAKDCTDSIHHLTNCIGYSANCILRILSTDSKQYLNESCKTGEEAYADDVNIEETKQVLSNLYNTLNSANCTMNQFDTTHLDQAESEEQKNNLNNEQNDLANWDNLSEISEPNYGVDIDETILISEPEDDDMKSTDDQSTGISQSKLESRKLVDGNNLDDMERLDKIWSLINTSYLQPYNPRSNEWREILNVLAKNQVNWSKSLRSRSATLSGGYLKPGDLKFIPPPSAKILTKKEYMNLLRRRFGKSGTRSCKLTDCESNDIHERYRDFI